MLLAAGALMVAGLFFFGVTIPPKKEVSAMQAGMGEMRPAEASVEFEVIDKLARGTLNTAQLDSIVSLEKQVKEVNSDMQKKERLVELAGLWERTGNILVAGKYYADAASTNSDKLLYEKAGDLEYFGFATTTDSIARIFGAQQGVRVYQVLAAMDSSNMEYPVREAVCYIDGLGNVMQGVTILKKVESKDPDNREMNLILGRLAVVSGQYDKAITRLEKLISLDPGNAEAYYHLAGAYRAVGRTDDAINSLEQCKALVKDPVFEAQIDEYIFQLKNP